MPNGEEYIHASSWRLISHNIYVSYNEGGLCQCKVSSSMSPPLAYNSTNMLPIPIISKTQSIAAKSLHYLHSAPLYEVYTSCQGFVSWRALNVHPRRNVQRRIDLQIVPDDIWIQLLQEVEVDTP